MVVVVVVVVGIFGECTTSERVGREAARSQVDAIRFGSRRCEAVVYLTTADLIIEQVSVTQRSLSVRKLRGTWLTRSESDSETSRSLTLQIRVGQEFWPIDFTADAQDPDRFGSKFSHSSNSRRNTMC